MKKEKGQRPQGLLDYIPVAPSETRPRDLDAIQVDNTNPPLNVRQGSFKGNEGGRVG